MNLLKKFIRDNNAVEDEDDEFNDLYVDEDLQSDMSASEERPAPAMGAATAPRASEPVSPEKVALKLMQPKSHAERLRISSRRDALSCWTSADWKKSRRTVWSTSLRAWSMFSAAR